jgi:hypothetical protein
VPNAIKLAVIVGMGLLLSFVGLEVGGRRQGRGLKMHITAAIVSMEAWSSKI